MAIEIHELVGKRLELLGSLTGFDLSQPNGTIQTIFTSRPGVTRYTPLFIILTGLTAKSVAVLDFGSSPGGADFTPASTAVTGLNVATGFQGRKVQPVAPTGIVYGPGTFQVKLTTKDTGKIDIAVVGISE